MTDNEYGPTLYRMEVALADLMSDVTEECYCAGWLSETPEMVWQLVTGEKSAWGIGDDYSDIEAVRALSQKLGVWIAGDYGNLVAVPLEDWKRSQPASGNMPDVPV